MKGKTMKTRIIATLATLAILTTVYRAAANEISGTIKVDARLEHVSPSTASEITETIATPYKWAGTGLLGTNGTAAGMTTIYAATLSIPATGTNALDLAGTLFDSFGATVNLARVKFMVFAPSNSMTAAQSVIVRPAGANGFATWASDSNATVRVWSGGCFAFFCPTTNAPAVTAGTGDMLEIVNESTNAATCKVIIGGQ
jgi:hypothetical protein